MKYMLLPLPAILSLQQIKTILIKKLLIKKKEIEKKVIIYFFKTMFRFFFINRCIKNYFIQILELVLIFDSTVCSFSENVNFFLIVEVS